jgi:GNAT superfamily N-acetyltransferase
MKCHYDELAAWYRCARSGEYVCLGHARLDVVSVSTRAALPAIPVRAARPSDRAAIEEIAMMYWKETEVECFGRTYDVLALPAFVALQDGQLAGVLSYGLEEDRLTIVMLNVHPEYQGRHVARALLSMAEKEGHAQGVARLVVTTSNDDLPALYLYQRRGFVIAAVKPGAILAHHGHEEAGFAGIPVRDAIQLEKHLGA